MEVRNLQAGDDHPGTFGTERGAYRPADALGDVHHSVEQHRLDVLPVVHLRARHHQCVALGHRLDGQERDNVIVLIDEATRYLPVDDHGENGRHGTRA